MRFRAKRKIAKYFFSKSEIQNSKETVPVLDRSKPLFSASQLAISRPRTPDDIRQAIRAGRFAEMSPDLAG